MIVGAMLVKVTEEMVEAVFIGQSHFRFADVAQAPFADKRRLVSGCFQHAGDGDVVGRQRLGLGVGATGVATNRGATMMLAGIEH